MSEQEQTNLNQNTETGENTEVVETVEAEDVEAEAVDTSEVVEAESVNSSENNNAESESIEAKPVFEVDDESEDESEEEVDLSKYTVLDADNLDEDKPIPGQEFALFSFMSPEGIMNCNVRLLKFRGAYPTIEAATAAADELKKKDKYFKIHAAESGKWVEFDPPEEHVEQVVAGNKKQQKIIDAQRKARMDNANELAGRYKQKIDKVDKGAESRVEESKKAGAAEDYANKNRSKSQAKKQAKQEKAQAQMRGNNRSSKAEAMRERLKKRLADKRAKEANEKRLEQTKEETDNRFGSGQVGVNVTTDTSGLKQKTEVVNKASDDLEKKKSELERTNANIDKIRKMMQTK